MFGIPDEEYGEAVCAVVQPNAGQGTVCAEDVQASLRERGAGYAVPRRVNFAEELPREDSGEIFKRKLCDAYWAGSGRAI